MRRPSESMVMLQTNHTDYLLGMGYLFSSVIFRRELGSAIKNVPVRVPWLTEIILIAILCYGLVSRGKASRKGHFGENADVIFDKPGQVFNANVMKPLLFPSETSHTRLFPEGAFFHILIFACRYTRRLAWCGWFFPFRRSTTRRTVLEICIQEVMVRRQCRRLPRARKGEPRSPGEA